MFKIRIAVLFLILCTPFAYIWASTQTFSSENILSLIKPATVQIYSEVNGTIGIQNFVFNYETFEIEEFGEVIEFPIEDAGQGTGFVVSSNGLVVTNAHITLVGENDIYTDITDYVIENATDEEVDLALQRIPDSEEAYNTIFDIVYSHLEKNSIKNFTRDITVLKPYLNAGDFETLVDNGFKAEIVYANSSYNKDGKDISIIKIDQENLPTIPLKQDFSKISTGQSMYTLGHPSSAFIGGNDFIEPSFTQGFINAVKIVDNVEYYQTDSNVSSGSSGSPVTDSTGEVIGILTGVSGDTTSGDTFGFVLKGSLLNDIINQEGIEITENEYRTNYINGLKYASDNQCKKAIQYFEKAKNVHPDFKTDTYVQTKIDECNQMIERGESFDSAFALLIRAAKNNIGTTLLILSGILIISLILVTKRSLTKRIEAESQELDQVEETIEKLEDTIEHMVDSKKNEAPTQPTPQTPTNITLQDTHQELSTPPTLATPPEKPLNQ
jgi:serine protease Do